MGRKIKYDDPYHQEHRERMRQTREKLKGLRRRPKWNISRKAYFRNLLAVALICVLVTAFSVNQIVAQTTLSTMWLMGGVYPGAPSYTIWKEGSNYLAKDANGQIVYSGTNASQMLINVVAQSPTSIFVEKATTAFQFDAPVNLCSNLILYSDGATLYVAGTETHWNGNNGLFNINNKENIVIRGFNFIINGDGGSIPSSTDPMAIASLGSQNLRILENTFTGNTYVYQGLIQFVGASATADFLNTWIVSNHFVNMPWTRAIKINPSSSTGYTANNTWIQNNVFEEVLGPVILVDGSAEMRYTVIDGNTFLEVDEASDSGVYGAAVQAGLGTADMVYDIFVTNNHYRQNSDYIYHEWFFAMIYSAHGVLIQGNTAIAPPAYDGGGGFVALGRVTWPCCNVRVDSNYVYGFGSFWDPDTMYHVEVSNNLIENGGIPSWGYGDTQDYINFHDNTFVEPHNATLPYGQYSLMIFGTSNPKYSRFADNIIVVERTNHNFTRCVAFPGAGYDFSQVIFEGNILRAEGVSLTGIYQYAAGTSTNCTWTGYNDFDGVTVP